MQFFTDFLSKKFIFFDVLKTEPVHPYTQVFMVQDAVSAIASQRIFFYNYIEGPLVVSFHM